MSVPFLDTETWYFQMRYTFAHVFDEFTTQKAVFDHGALALVDDVLHGKNGERCSFTSK